MWPDPGPAVWEAGVGEGQVGFATVAPSSVYKWHRKTEELDIDPMKEEHQFSFRGYCPQPSILEFLIMFAVLSALWEWAQGKKHFVNYVVNLVLAIWGSRMPCLSNQIWEVKLFCIITSYHTANDCASEVVNISSFPCPRKMHNFQLCKQKKKT